MLSEKPYLTAKESDEKVGAAEEGVPQPLKRQYNESIFGTAEAVPLSRTVWRT
jgi:hypothetical protein